MTISAAIAKLADVLYAVNPAPEDPPRTGCIYTNPREAVTIADFPSIVMGLSATTPERYTEEALGLMRHDYVVAMWVFLGIRQTPLSELHARALPWSLAIATVLSANLTLGGVVNQLGPGVFDQPLVTFKLGPINWGVDGNGQPLVYWGLTGQLPIVEKHDMEMGAGI